VLPIFHEVIPVNMNTLKLEVMRNKAESLITKDRVRRGMGGRQRDNRR
jgi:uncharacterized membrane protein YqiK